MTAQLALDLFPSERQARCPWLEEWYGHPHCYLSMTFRFDCGVPCSMAKGTDTCWERAGEVEESE